MEDKKEEYGEGKNNTQEEYNTLSEANKKDNYENNINEKHLTRAQRKRLRKQQFKDEQRVERKRQRKLRLYRKIAIISIAIIILVLGGYFLFSGPKIVVPLRDNDPIIGTVNAPLTIIEFGDFKCPFTKQFNTKIMPALFAKYGDKINIVYKDMPTGRHGDSITPAMAAECVNEQGKFKEYHDLLFANQHIDDKLGYIDLARNLDINLDLFRECLESNKYKSEVLDDYKTGKRAKVDRTPTLFINGVIVKGIVDDYIYEDIIDNQLKTLS
jgi:protein-disulfide isomerase